MTHVRNVEAFEKLLGFCTGYGGKYKPGPSNLQLETLMAQLRDVKQTMERVKITKNLFDVATNDRKEEFGSLPGLASSVWLTMAASGSKEETLKDANLYLRQIKGQVRSREPIPSAQAGELKSRRSSLQLAYVHKADWFSKLVQMLDVETLYTPQEAELKRGSLQARANKLSTMNAGVANARVAWSNALIERNKVLYGSKASLYNTTTAVKRYVRAIFGTNSPEYAQVKALIFTKPAKS